jgi:molecular chaperone HtpG
MVGTYKEKAFRSVTAGGSDLAKIKKDEAAEDAKTETADDGAIAKLVLAFKDALGDAVKEVRASDRLTESAVCLIAGDGDMDLHLARMLRRQGHLDVPAAARILEINPGHALIKALAGMVDNPGKAAEIGDTARLLLDQARIVEGESLADPAGFSARLNAALQRGLAA